MNKKIELNDTLFEEKNNENGRSKYDWEYNLSKGWKWIKIKDVVREFKGGFAKAKKYSVEKGVPHLRPNNVGYFGELNLSHLVFLEPKIVDLKKYSLKKGDVLFNNTNSKELVGRASLVNENLNFAFSNHITRLRVNRQIVTPQWLTLCINYLWVRGFFLKICRKWIGQAGVNISMLKSTIIPVPPIKEQVQIASKVSFLLSNIEEAEGIQAESVEILENAKKSVINSALNREL